MSLWSKIKGTVESAFQIGLGGPLWKNTSGILSARDPLDSAYVIVRGDDPVNPNDLVTKQYGDANYGGGGGGGSMHTGTIIIDFGVYPGKSDTTVSVIGQTGIAASSVVGAWIFPKATPEHSVDEHKVEEIEVIADGNSIVPGTGFDIYARARNDKLYGEWYVAWQWATP